MIVSTCNRVEILASLDSPDADLAAFIHRHFGVDPALLAPHLYQHRDQDVTQQEKLDQFVRARGGMPASANEREQLFREFVKWSEARARR